VTVDVSTGQALHAALVGELAWLDPAGRPQLRPVTPLLQDDRPSIALPYSEATLAREVAASPVVAFILSDRRMSSRAWHSVAVWGQPRLTEDREGALFTEHLLTQEMRKFPPARTLIDSPLLRREHWWYVPRLIVDIDVSGSAPVGERPEGAGEVLAVAGGSEQLYVDTVSCLDEGHDQILVDSLADRSPVSGPAVLLGHDFSPDLETWTPWTTRGWLTDRVLAVQERPERTGLAPPPRLWDRLRRQHRLERACRRGLGD
jgi:hypothetical protein